MLSFIILMFCAINVERRYDECHSPECHCAECCGANLGANLSDATS
jgi:hypothetical protein